MNQELLKQEIRKVDQALCKGWVALRDFNEHTGISKRTVLKLYDSWSDACKDAGVNSGPTRGLIKPKRSTPKAACEADLLRVAALIAPYKLSRTLFKKHAAVPMRSIAYHWGSFTGALRALGIGVTDQYYEFIPLDVLAKEFLAVAIELHRVPSLAQVTRRSQHGEYRFSGKHGGYDNFKRQAIAFLFQSSTAMPTDVETLLKAELVRLTKDERSDSLSPSTPPHHHGRVLGFRSFPYAPTYEAEVVGIFNAVADELGFEILCNRSAFPDCQARRKVPGPRNRYEDCLIEFELRSKDFKTHNHPAESCDLIVCWKHNWPECPVEVLELSETIKKLPGWK